MGTFSAKSSEVQPQWWVIDATDQVLGQVAVKAANLLRGKEKVIYTPHCDTGDFVIVINAEKVRVTGKKAETIEYDTYSRYPGGRHLYSFKVMQAKHPEKLVELAVRRMLPKNKLARNILGKLKIYRGGTHPHAAQQPKELKFA